MKEYHATKRWTKLLSWLLAATLLFSNLETAAFVQAAAGDNVISIQTAEDLAKIGTDSQYPMNGDYILEADIDLSNSNWTPMGGYIGNKGTCNPEEANVFSGTFDGQGHVISGMTINLSGSIYQENKYGQVGLFSVIGSNNGSDYAEVKNLIFTDVNIYTDFSDGLAAIGTLAGEVNGYANVSGIAVLNGSLNINRSGVCDTVGAGGIIGECRTQDAIGNGNISVTNCYNGADIVSNGKIRELIYAGGIIGRVAKSNCKSISQCVNTGIVQFGGDDAYGISAAEGMNAQYLSTLTDSYFLSDFEQMSLGGTTPISRADMTSGVLPGNLSGENWRAEQGCYPVPAFCYDSSAAGMIYLSGLSLAFAEGETASSVKTEIVLPQVLGEQAITWSSSDPNVLTVAEGKATAHPEDIGTNTTVVLTAQTANGYSRNFKLVVQTANEQVAAFDQGYAQVGVPLTVSVSNTEGMVLNYQWSVDGQNITNNSNSYTPSKEDLEKFISVVVTAGDSNIHWNLSIYCSELPVIYVDTNDGREINSNTVAQDAVMKIQGNAEFQDPSTWYQGATTIRGRGNSTWSFSQQYGLKKPYKLKLDTKANLLGLGTGTNKHWVLLSNIIDHTNMRNELAYNFSRDIGMEVSMGTTNVVLILNGTYQGIYELSEHVRVGKARVNVTDWEGIADDIAKAICKKVTTLDRSALETAMEEDFSWMSGSFQYQGNTYNIADYYTQPIPEFTGGFLLDMDFRSAQGQYQDKFVTTFQTTNGIPMFFRSPEFAKTSSEMVDYARNYMNAYEAAIASADFTTDYNGETVHYTDLFDMDSLLQYWLLCEYVNNWDSMKNSTYLYKDLEGKAKMGPAWDYDWAWGNINMYSMTGPFVYDNWHTTLTGMDAGNGGFAEQAYQKRQWNRYLVKDPYFVTKAYEFYKKYRPTVIEDMIKENGVIDTLTQKYQKASEANDDKWSYSYNLYGGKAFVDGNVVDTQSQNYNEAVASMKTFIQKRVDWLDQQFTSVEGLYSSLGNQVSDKISVSVKEAEDGTVTAQAEVKDSSAAFVTFLVNGKKVLVDNSANIPVSNGKASAAIDLAMLETAEGALNTVEVLGVNQSKDYISGVMNFVTFTKGLTEPEPGPGDDKPTPKPEVLKGTVTITSSRSGEISYPGDTLSAAIANTNNSGKFSYQWYAGETAIAGATKDSYVLTAQEVGKKVSVKVTSSVETGTIQGMYEGTVQESPSEPTPKPEELKGSVTVTSDRGGDFSYPGDTLSAAVTNTNNSGDFSYQWYADKTAIKGATKDSYKLTEEEIGKKLSVQVTSSVETGTIQGVYEGTIEDPTIVPGPIPEDLTGKVMVTSSRSGKVSYPGDKLSAAVKDTNNTGKLKYQWYADKTAIKGATKSSFTLTTKQIGKKLTVQVTSTMESGGIKGTYSGTIKKKPVKATKITLSVKSKKLYAYQSFQLKATVTPKAASQKVKYSTSKSSVATVSSTGKVTAKAPGTAKITVKAQDGSGVKAVCTITVNKPVIKVSGKSTVKPKKSITLKAKLYGLKGKITWKLDAKGKKLLKLNKKSGSTVKLTAGKKTGTAKLTVTCGKKKVTKTIRVKK